MLMISACIIGCAGLLSLLPVGAGRAESSTATPPLFATNTPPARPLVPDAPLERYALRLWDENSLVSVLLDQTSRLTSADADRKLAIRLLQNELRHRFPNAPKDASQRAALLKAIMAAPRGMVDARPVMHAVLQDTLNRLRPSFTAEGTVRDGDFQIDILPANLDGIPATVDAVLHTRYPVNADSTDLRYEDFVMAQITAGGTYRVVNATPDFPAAPLDGISFVNLQRLGDLNKDGLDELALSTNGDGVNQRLVIYGLRSNAAVDLIAPRQTVLFGDIPNWPQGGGSFTVRQYRVESPAWNCRGERDVTWTWSFNYFRPPDRLDNFTFQSRLACLLFGAEPYFSVPVTAALDKIQSIVPFAQTEDLASVQRAKMMTAMLHLLDGDTAQAVSEVNELATSAQPGTWLAAQTSAFQQAIQLPGVTAVQVCAALADASPYGACDVDELLQRLFTDQPLRRDQPISNQLAAMGIKVLDTATITALNRADRQAVHFVMGGDHWWAFAPLAKDAYTAEKIDPPPGFGPTATPVPTAIRPPQNAYDALLVDGDAASALNVLDSALRLNPNAKLEASARYLQALCYDLLVDRAAARRAYFQLWKDAPTTVWGQLAAAHLEQR
jgi:tetratricopeptide (TPR) repeat protein